tara:strand:- start:733 stop:1308 length:576 start_codon:yes stop_codon:yes gene_type:complete
MHKDNIIKIFKNTGALLDGHFILTSGLHSPSYFQCAKVLQYPKYLTELSKIISEKFNHETIDVVISPAVGGIVFGTEIGRLLNARTIFAERKNGEMTIRRGFHIKPNENVLVVEDVITTGGSVKEVMDLVENNKGNIIGLGILVDRSNGEIELHDNQFSIIALKVESYDEKYLPKSLSLLPVQKPGSRHTI